MADLIDNKAGRRFEMTQDGTLTFVDYEEKDGRFVLTHTVVPPSLGGKGAGTKLVRAVLDELQARGARIVPQCPFIARFIEKNPQYAPLAA